MLKTTQINKIQILFLTLIFSYTINAQVGIGTIDPHTELDVDGAISLREGSALNLSNGINDNVSLGGNTYSSYRIIGPSASFTITGIAPETNADGQIVTLENTTTYTMTLAHNTTTSTNINRIYCPGANNYTLVGQYATVTLQYNASQSRWIIINYADKRYGDNIQSSVGTSSITKDGTSWTTMSEMDIAFNPVHSTVYVSFSASGDASTISFASYADFRMQLRINGGNWTHVTGADVLYIDDYFIGFITSWNSQFVMFPVSVTPGQSARIRIQWRDSQSGGSVIRCDPARVDSHRNLTIFD